MLTGYIKKIFFDKKNDMSEDDEDEVKISHYVILQIIDENNDDYTIKGNTQLKPEIGDEIEMTDYKQIYNEKYDRYDYETDTIIIVNLPEEQDKIIERILNLKIPKYGKTRIENLVYKHGSELWDRDILEDLIEDEVMGSWNTNIPDSVVYLEQRR